MERLTKYIEHSDGSKHAVLTRRTPVENALAIPAALDRLAAYEDTGLEPDDVTDLMAAHGTAILKLAEAALKRDKGGNNEPD